MEKGVQFFCLILVVFITLLFSGYVTFFQGDGPGKTAWLAAVFFYLWTIVNLFGVRYNSEEKRGFVYLIYGLSVFNLYIYIWPAFGVNIGIWNLAVVPPFYGFIVFVFYKFFKRKWDELAASLNYVYWWLKNLIIKMS
ncbi:hypothetical protein [Acidihalobacter prosperus]|uniref:hypothetical protein n=1 Tax=Acidihalobacter prosperus TaxID=160660 RepID=UPI0011AB2F70|nr:hypothetical protein [Acidihalobacter prosperus]